MDQRCALGWRGDGLIERNFSGLDLLVDHVCVSTIYYRRGQITQRSDLLQCEYAEGQEIPVSTRVTDIL